MITRVTMNYITSKKGIIRLKMSQISTIFMYAVWGSWLVTPINIVVRTNIAVRLTVMIVSKKKSWNQNSDKRIHY